MYFNTDLLFVRMPLNIMTTPSNADNIIAFIVPNPLREFWVKMFSHLYFIVINQIIIKINDPLFPCHSCSYRIFCKINHRLRIYPQCDHKYYQYHQCDFDITGNICCIGSNSCRIPIKYFLHHI